MHLWMNMEIKRWSCSFLTNHYSFFILVHALMKKFTFWIERGASIKLMTADDIAPFIIIPQLPTRARHPQLTETRDSEPEPRKPRTFRDLTDHLHCPRCPLVHQPISGLPLVKSCPLTIWRQRNKCCDGALWHPAFGKCLFWTHIVIIWLLAIDSTEKVNGSI